MQRKPQVRNLAVLAAAFLLLSVNALTVPAQSGRHQTRSSSTPAQVEEPQPAVTAKTDDRKPAADLIVGIEQGGSFDVVPLYYYQLVLDTCTSRLGSSPLVNVTSSSGNVRRAQAINRAKSEKTARVIWLELKSDRTGSNNNVDDVREVRIDYLVLAPTTAKVQASGSVYQRRGVRKGPVVVGPPGTTNTRVPPAYLEYMLKEAAKEAADRILSSLHLGAGDATP